MGHQAITPNLQDKDCKGERRVEMLRKVGLVKWTIVAIALSLFLLGSSVYATTRTATVALHPNDALSPSSGTVATTGSITVTSSTGPSGSATLEATVHTTVAGHFYALYLGRSSQTFRILNIFYFTGSGSEVTIQEVLDRAPTNGQSFEVWDVTVNANVATSDPISY